MKSTAGFGVFCSIIGFIIGIFFVAIIVEGKREPAAVDVKPAIPNEADVLDVTLISGCCYLYRVLIDNEEYIVNSRGGIAQK